MDADLERYYLPALRECREGYVLDFGSGHGRVLTFLGNAGFQGVHGFERDESLRGAMTPEVQQRTTFGTDWRKFLREAGRKWDAVILKDVLYYFDDSEAETFLRELKPHLTPGAILAVEVFNGATLTGAYVMHKDRGIRRVFTEHSIRALLESSGYAVKSVDGLGIPITGVRSALYGVSFRAWKAVLRVVYWCERGTDAQNPRILDKKIFAVARATSL